MKIRLKTSPRVDERHKMTVGRVLKVIREDRHVPISGAARKGRLRGWWVRGEREDDDVLVLAHEAEVLEP